MSIIDKIAMNRLIKIIGDFILALLKMFQPNDDITKPEKKRPIIDKLKNIFKKE
jgi:hypothetical protein